MGLNIECWTLPFHFQSFHSSIIRFNLNVGSWPRQLVSFIFVIFNKAPYPTQLDIFWSCMSIHSYSSIGIDLWFMYSVHYFVFDALPALATVPCLIFLSQWGQLSQILHPNSSSVRWMTLQPLWTWVRVPARVSLCVLKHLCVRLSALLCPCAFILGRVV